MSKSSENDGTGQLNQIDRLTKTDAFDRAEDYHEASKHYRATPRRDGQAFADYMNDIGLIAMSAQPRRKISGRPPSLLPDRTLLQLPLEVALSARRSVRPEMRASISAEDFAAILWAGDGFLDGSRTPAYRTHASPGGLYPLGVFLAVRAVQGIDPGLYDYRPEEEALRPLGGGADSVERAFYALGRDDQVVENSAVAVFVVADMTRLRVKYGQRSYRFALLETGLVGANMSLASTALDIPSLPLGGYLDAEIEEIFGLDGVNEIVTGCWAIGGAVGGLD